MKKNEKNILQKTEGMFGDYDKIGNIQKNENKIEIEKINYNSRIQDINSYKNLYSEIKNLNVELENEQKKWLKNRDIKAKKDAKEAEGGTMEPLLFTSSIKDLNEARAIELAKRYDEIVNKK